MNTRSKLTAGSFTSVAETDALAFRLMKSVQHLRFDVAQSRAEREEVYRLRYSVAIENGWGKPELFPDGLERDDYDGRAIQLVAWDNSVLAATTRLVLPSQGQALPTEKVFNIKVAPRGQVVDVGRTCVTPEYRGERYRVLIGLQGWTWLQMRSHGFSELCGILSPSMIKLYRRIGVEVLILGDPVSHWGEQRYPILIRPAESTSTIFEKLKLSKRVLIEE